MISVQLYYINIVPRYTCYFKSVISSVSGKYILKYIVLLALIIRFILREKKRKL